MVIFVFLRDKREFFDSLRKTLLQLNVQEGHCKLCIRLKDIYTFSQKKQKRIFESRSYSMVHHLKEPHLLDGLFGTSNFINMLANNVTKVNDQNCDFGSKQLIPLLQREKVPVFQRDKAFGDQRFLPEEGGFASLLRVF